jgi:hypothetical protein
MRERHGYPEITVEDKRKILGLNSARLYGITATGASDIARYNPVPADFETRIPEKLKTLLEFPGFAADNIARFKERYAAAAPTPDNLRYGWIRRDG